MTDQEISAVFQNINTEPVQIGNSNRITIFNGNNENNLRLLVKRKTKKTQTVTEKNERQKG